MQRRTITKLLRKNYSIEKKRGLVLHWASAWEKEQNDLLKRLGIAVRDDDYDALCKCTGQLKKMSGKKFMALSNSLQILLDRDVMQKSLDWTQNAQDESDLKSFKSR